MTNKINSSLQKTKMYKAYLIIGGNVGNTLEYFKQAIQLIEKKCGSITKSSAIYCTAAWGITNQSDFLNQVLVVNTHLTPNELIKEILAIELLMGRERSIKMGPRIIDIDILLINDLIISTNILTLPHPQLTNRKFALTPLAEIAPNKIHPIENKTINQLLQLCTDNLNVQKIK